MRTLIRREPPVTRPVRHDPAPSRAAYRMQRFWLSPWLRWIVTTVLPVCAVATLATMWFIQPAQQQKLTGVVAQVRAQVEARPEFQIRQMAITGASPVLADAIRERLALNFPVSWFHLDTVAIHDNVVALDAVAEARVTVELGGALHVDVRERQPAVLWRRADGVEILDDTGHRIAFIDRRDGRADLPLITGDGADAAVPEALMLFDAAKPIAVRVRALTRQGERRWDVVLDRGQVIQLPEIEPKVALERVIAMQQTMDLLARDVPVVDVRNSRMTIRIGSTAAETLQATQTFKKEVVGQ